MNLPTRHEIASVAALLLRDGKTPVAACREAMELLEIASFAEGAMRAADAFTTSGIDRWEERQQAIGHRIALEKRTPKFNVIEGQGEEDDRILWTDFERHLEPRNDSEDKVLRFRQWLAHFMAITPLKAGEQIARFKKQGVPAQIVRFYFWGFREWWEETKREQKSKAGKKGQAAKKARVVKKP